MDHHSTNPRRRSASGTSRTSTISCLASWAHSEVRRPNRSSKHTHISGPEFDGYSIFFEEESLNRNFVHFWSENTPPLPSCSPCVSTDRSPGGCLISCLITRRFHFYFVCQHGERFWLSPVSFISGNIIFFYAQAPRGMRKRDACAGVGWF